MTTIASRGTGAEGREAEGGAAGVPAPVPGDGPDRSWIARANCVGINPDAFYPERGYDAQVAKAVCAGCDVRDACLSYAMETGEIVGVWGGLTAGERRRLQHRRSRS